MVPWMGGSIPESTHDKYWESAFYNRLLVRSRQHDLSMIACTEGW
jgi:hypothetical protein